MVAIYKKNDINKLLQFGMIYKTFWNFTWAAIYSSLNLPPWKMTFTTGLEPLAE